MYVLNLKELQACISAYSVEINFESFVHFIQIIVIVGKALGLSEINPLFGLSLLF